MRLDGLLTREPGVMVIRWENKEGCDVGLNAGEWVKEFDVYFFSVIFYVEEN